MITNEEIERALHLRLQGLSYEQIGRMMNYSGTSIRRSLLLAINQGPLHTRCVYPEIQKVISERYGGRIYALAKACGLHSNYIYTVLNGRQAMSERMAQRLAETTGLSMVQVMKRA